MKPSVAPWTVSIAMAMASAALAVPFDHLDCRRVRDSGPRRRVQAEMIARDPRLAARDDCTILTPARYLCTASEAADRRPEPSDVTPGPEAHDYLCYRARCLHDRQQVAVRDAFGERTLFVKGTSFVCAPLELPGVSSTTTTMPPTTSTVPPAATTTSTQPPATSTSTTTSSTLATSTTVAPSTTTTTSSTSSSTTTTVAVPEPPSHGCPVVNEVMTGSDASASEEVVEILNPCSTALDLSGARLIYQSASGATQRTLVEWESGTVLEPGGRLLYATSQYAGPVDGAFSAGLSGSGGGVGVVEANGTVIDGVGYGTAVNSLVEGTAAPAPSAGDAIARIPDGVDTDDGASDWRQATPTPGAPND